MDESDPRPAEEKKTLRPARRRASRRLRLRLTIAVLVVTVLVAAVAATLLYRAGRPDVRRPGEDLDDITDKLTRQLPAEAPVPRFTDITATAGLDRFVTFEGARTSQLPEDLGSGLTWGDFDNDGDDDLFLVSAGGALDLPRERWAPSELYENRTGEGEGVRFLKVEEFPETRISGMAAAWGDADGDGWLDLAVTGYGSLLFFRNRQGRLEREGALPNLDGYWAGAAWGDFDNDRDLDLYVCGYVRYQPPAPDAEGRTTEQYGAAVPYTLNPASFEPERNLLLRNDGTDAGGAVTFTDVAALYGVSNPEGRSLTALWHDFDDDGRLDLYVANDISDNALYLNRGDTFEDAGLRAFVADYRGAMGLTAGDWNRDGDDDLFITHWVAQENALYDSRLAALRAAADPGAPVRLSFSDMAVPLGLGQIALQLVGWGTEFADFDGDGWLDLIVANGSTLEDDQQPRGLRPQPPLLLWNRRGEHFHDLAAASEVLSPPHVSRGLALADVDRDGDLDVAVFHRGEGVQLLRNDMQTGRWLELRLRSLLAGGEPRGFGDGATVIVSAGGVELRRSVTSASYLSQSSRNVHFGLGTAERAERVEVRWLAGEPQVFEGLDADTLWQLTEGEPTARRIAFTSTASAAAAPADPVDEPVNDKARVLEFWSTQRAAMDALKRDGNIDRAAGLFRRALRLNPGHSDSRYYLASCLTFQGHTEEALAELDRLRRDDPTSHRAHKQWGVLRAMTAASPADLDAAHSALERALEINPEETGSLLVLGEIAILTGDQALAAQRLEWACRTNPRAVGGFFLRGYLAWKRGDRDAAAELLATAHAARGEDWKPEGAVAEGDVLGRMHREETPLSEYWEAWDGTPDPADAYGALDAHLETVQN